MIKKYLLGFGLITIGTITFCNGERIVRNNNSFSTSNLDNNIQINVTNGGQLQTESYGNTKNMIAYASNENEKIYFFWSLNHKPYYFIKNGAAGFKQGFLKYFYICSGKIEDLGYYPVTELFCNKYNITDDFENQVGGFFNSITNNDTRGYNVATHTCNGKATFQAQTCFYSTQYNSTFCFSAGGNNVNGCVTYDTDSLENSLNFNESTNFYAIPNNYITTPPGYNGNNNINNTILNTPCPTIKQLMTNMGEEYNTGMCYNSTIYYNGTEFETVTKDDIFTIFNNNYDTYSNRLSIYRNNCKTPATQQNCVNAFSGEFKKYSIISNAINGGVDEKKLRNYCNLGLNYPPNATTCTASGTINEDYTTEEKLEMITSYMDKITVPNTESGNSVFNSLCDPDDEECLKGNVRDIFGSLENIYNKIVSLFQERKNVNGIIPDYILWITFLTILFTVLFKK